MNKVELHNWHHQLLADAGNKTPEVVVLSSTVYVFYTSSSCCHLLNISAQCFIVLDSNSLG